LIVSKQKNQYTLAMIGDGELASNTPFPPAGSAAVPHRAAVSIFSGLVGGDRKPATSVSAYRLICLTPQVLGEV